MSKGDLERPATFLKRPIKPLSLALSMAMLTIFYFNVLTDTGVLVTSFWGQVVGFAAGASAVFMVAAWCGKSQYLAEVGLLLAAGVYISRTVLIALLDEWSTYTFWFSVSWCVAAVGAYLLEAFDPIAKPPPPISIAAK